MKNLKLKVTFRDLIGADWALESFISADMIIRTGGDFNKIAAEFSADDYAVESIGYVVS